MTGQATRMQFLSPTFRCCIDFMSTMTLRQCTVMTMLTVLCFRQRSVRPRSPAACCRVTTVRARLPGHRWLPLWYTQMAPLPVLLLPSAPPTGVSLLPSATPPSRLLLSSAPLPSALLLLNAWSRRGRWPRSGGR